MLSVGAGRPEIEEYHTRRQEFLVGIASLEGSFDFPNVFCRQGRASHDIRARTVEQLDASEVPDAADKESARCVCVSNRDGHVADEAMNGRKHKLIPLIWIESLCDGLKAWPHESEIKGLTAVSLEQLRVLRAGKVILADDEAH